MPVDRRRFLAHCALSLLAAPLPGRAGQAAYAAAETGAREDRSARWLSACRLANGTYAAAGLDSGGRTCWQLPLPGRGHGFCLDPERSLAFAPARRPGSFLLALDTTTGAVIAEAEAPAGRHFYGHAALSTDGGRLFTTENAFESGDGVIGVWEIEARPSGVDLRRLGELPAHGIGPHELIVDRVASPSSAGTHAPPSLPAERDPPASGTADSRAADAGADGGDTLIIAIGGIRTHPDTGRSKLNLDSMAPALAYVDAATGALLERVEPPGALHRLSIRHLARGTDGIVCIGMQFQADDGRRPPLLGLHRPGRELLLRSAPEPLHRRQRNYCGSIAVDSSGQWFAASAPRGGLVTFWKADGQFAGSAELADGCGVAAAGGPGRFLLSSGDGTLALYDAAAAASTPLATAGALRWDNHLAARAVA
ncbi:MAG: DUF1513 domain-containing protein [Thiohalocapsa sp.]|nr:DUF1513 domain-containing protein [Thiohalocapsa sp.]